MSTRTTLYFSGHEQQPDEGKHESVIIHVYREMQDGQIYLEIDCDSCYSGIKVIVGEHLGANLIKAFLPES